MIDDYGTIYLFNKKETSQYFTYNSQYVGGHRNNSYKWVLTEMISANKTDTIRFEYLEGSFDTGLIPIFSSFKTINCNDINETEYGWYQILTQKQKLKKIIAATGWMEFTYFANNPNLVCSASVYDYAGELIKTFRFDFVSPKSRPLLSKITEFAAGGDSLPPYQFYYRDTVNIPPLSAQFYADLGGFPGNPVDTSKTSPASFSARMPNSNSTAGILYEAYYPKGSFIHFDYEQNTFYMSNEPAWNDTSMRKIIMQYSQNYDTTNYPAPGLRVKSILQGDGTSIFRTDYEYLSEDGKSSGRYTDYPFYDYEFYYTYLHNGMTKTEKCRRSSDNLLNLFSPEIYYQRVLIYHGGKESTGKGKNGKTINTYKMDPANLGLVPGFVYPLRVSADKVTSLPETSETYDARDSLKSKIINFYKLSPTSTKAIGHKVMLTNTVNPGFNSKAYYLKQKEIVTDSMVSITYDDNQNMLRSYTKLIYSTPVGDDYEPDPDLNNTVYTSLYPLFIKTTNSLDETIQKKIVYPDYVSSDLMHKYIAINYHMYAMPVAEEVYVNNLFVSGIKTNFANYQGINLVLPNSVSVVEDGQYITKSFMDSYNKYGMLTQSHGIDGVHQCLLYGYNQTMPVAEVSNAALAEVFYTSFEDTLMNGIIATEAKTGNKSFNGNFQKTMPAGNYLVSFWKKMDTNWEYNEFNSTGGLISINGHIDEVRIHPLDAYMITKTWKPSVGITSVSNPNGISAYNEYDQFGRLKSQLDQDKLEINRMEYNHYSLINAHKLSVSGSGAAILTCNVPLSASLSPEAIEPPAWQWFDNYCNGNLVGSTSTYNAALPYNSYDDIIPLDTNYLFSKTYYVRAIIDGKCLPCQEKVIRYFRPTFSVNPVYEYNYQANSNISIPLGYTACEQNWTAVKKNQATWLSISNNGSNLQVNLQQNTGTSTRWETILLSNPGNLTTTSFNIYQLAQFKLELTTSLTDSARVYATITGGKAPYVIKWYVNNVLRPETGNTLSLAKGQTYTVRCDVTDACSGPQSQSKQIDFVAYTPMVLNKTVDIVNGIITMQVFVSGGTPAFTYKWYKNGVLQSNTTSIYSGKYKSTDTFCCKVTDNTIPKQEDWICNTEIQTLKMKQSK
jgi:YD repeat-containing protein